jgi:3-hydroxybutyryl-CoA dehydratase
MGGFHVAIGDEVRFAKTVGETDVYMFAGITGDFAANHVNEEVMRRSAYGTRIAHGALLIGYMSAASSILCNRATATGGDELPVSLGYDRVRFIKAVKLGDTITVVYTIVAVEPERRRSRAKVEVFDQNGDLAAAAEHILKWVKNAA